MNNANNMYPMVETISLKKEIQSFCHKRLTPLVNRRMRVRFHDTDDGYGYIKELTSTLVNVDAWGGLHFLSGKAVYPLDIETIELIDQKQNVIS